MMRMMTMMPASGTFSHRNDPPAVSLVQRTGFKLLRTLETAILAWCQLSAIVCSLNFVLFLVAILISSVIHTLDRTTRTTLPILTLVVTHTAHHPAKGDCIDEHDGCNYERVTLCAFDGQPFQTQVEFVSYPIPNVRADLHPIYSSRRNRAA